MSEDDTVRSQYRTLTENEKTDMQAIKNCGQDLLDHINTVASHSGDSRELSLARTRAEEAVMWATKHITA